MDNISIKDHPPWYARGTPVTHNRDGPAFDLSAYVVPDNVKMEAIRGEPSARGEPKGKTRLWLTLKTTFFNTQNSVYGWWYGMLFGDADRSRDAVRSVEEDLSAFAEPDNVERKMVDVDSFVGDADRSRDAVRSVEEDLSAFAEPDNVKLEEDNVKMEMGSFIDADGNISDADRSKDAVRSGGSRQRRKTKGRMNCITTNFN